MRIVKGPVSLVFVCMLIGFSAPAGFTQSTQNPGNILKGTQPIGKDTTDNLYHDIKPVESGRTVERKKAKSNVRPKPPFPDIRNPADMMNYPFK